MKDFTFVSGNEEKARYLSLWLDLPLPFTKYDLPEIQSIELKVVAKAKVKAAYMQFKRPVIVEDVGLLFHGLGRLPGPFIKWFVQEIGSSGLCKLADTLPDRTATAEIIYAAYDGQTIQFFDGSIAGTIAKKPTGNSKFGWNPVFIPNGQTKTYAQMSDEVLRSYSHRAIAITKLKEFLEA